MINIVKAIVIGISITMIFTVLVSLSVPKLNTKQNITSTIGIALLAYGLSIERRKE